MQNKWFTDQKWQEPIGVEKLRWRYSAAWISLRQEGFLRCSSPFEGVEKVWPKKTLSLGVPWCPCMVFSSAMLAHACSITTVAPIEATSFCDTSNYVVNCCQTKLVCGRIDNWLRLLIYSWWAGWSTNRLQWMHLCSAKILQLKHVNQFPRATRNDGRCTPDSKRWSSPYIIWDFTETGPICVRRGGTQRIVF